MFRQVFSPNVTQRDVPADSLMYLQTKYNMQTARKDSSLLDMLKDIRRQCSEPPQHESLGSDNPLSKLKKASMSDL